MKNLLLLLPILLFTPFCVLAEDAPQTETVSSQNSRAALEAELKKLGFEYEITGDSVTVTEYTGGAEVLVIPDGVTRIGDGAFFFCEDPFGEKDSLKSVTLPESVMEIGSQAFIMCNDLKEFCVSPGNTHFKSIDGSLFTADGKTLIHVPGGRKLTEYIVPDGVTEIGDFAFCNCFDLCSVRLPNGIRSIGDHAFGDCAELNSLELPDSLTQIGDLAFTNCPFTSLTLPENVTHLGERLFWNCERLMEICVSPGNTHFKSIDGILFTADGKILIHVPGGRKLAEYIVPDGVTKIGDFAFEDCDTLTAVTFPDSVTKIGLDAFCWCENLTLFGNPDSCAEEYAKEYELKFQEIAQLDENSRAALETELKKLGFEYEIHGDRVTVTEYTGGAETLKIPDGVTKIGDSAFLGCESLTSVTFPESLTEIGASAFQGCGSLTSVTLPENVLTVGDGAFAFCWKLTEIRVSPKNGNFKSIDGILFTADGKTLVQFPNGRPQTEYTIPENVSRIGPHAFAGCGSLKSVTLPHSVTEIGPHTFNGCACLEFVKFTASVMKIGPFTFANCVRLQHIQLPNGVKSVEEGLFFNCENLLSVTFPRCAETVCKNAFYGCENLKSVTFPDTMKTIETETFDRCTRLQIATIPSCETEIGAKVFYDCDDLTIRARAGSKAAKYAKENGFPFEKLAP
ncbi:MAG: leucine-rich repeat protein [Thermoguttaceae bacterium]|nr:leucine-rich repeat protein [Thermoguttaceae bacterium]